MWEPGDIKVVRDIWHGHVLTRRPVTVVADEPERLALYWSPGTVWKHAINAGTVRSGITASQALDAMFSAPPVELADRTWADTHVLRLSEPDAAHSIWLMWDEEWTFDCWYINLEEPCRRWEGGIDTCDQVLDIVVRPDGRVRWKDEEQFERGVGRGWFTRREADAIRAEGERALEKLDRRDRTWTSWRPDPAWSPALPA